MQSAFAAIKAANDAGIDPNKLAGLHLRLAAATHPEDVKAISARIAAVDTRLATLPQHLSVETREEIAMWEGQIDAHRFSLYASRDIPIIEARIAKLMAVHPDFDQLAANQSEAFAALDASMADLATTMAAA